MCRRAVDRSQGQLTDLSIDYFGDDELLNYVALRCSNLRRLAIEDPSDISSSGLTEAVKKLPRLEALHVMNKSWLDPRDVETIGLSCSLMDSFSSNAKVRFAEAYKHTTLALAIARTMPSLHQLQLFGDTMTNAGLEAILDGCPHLELLDVHDSYGLDLKAETLVERCSKQIKDVALVGRQHLDDFLDFYRFDSAYILPRIREFHALTMNIDYD